MTIYFQITLEEVKVARHPNAELVVSWSELADA
jgi:hypothetical protein